MEITKEKKFEDCLLSLMGNLPRIRDQVICMGLTNRAKNDWIESWAGSVEMLENCVREIRKVSPLIQPPLQLSKIANPVENQQIPLPYLSPTGSRESPPSSGSSTPNWRHSKSPLSQRENEIVRLLAVGKSNKEISAALKLSVKTVETYRARIMLKLNFHSISEVVRYAVRTNMIEP